jgi:hypothetical protein
VQDGNEIHSPERLSGTWLCRSAATSPSTPHPHYFPIPSLGAPPTPATPPQAPPPLAHRAARSAHCTRVQEVAPFSPRLPYTPSNERGGSTFREKFGYTDPCRFGLILPGPARRVAFTRGSERVTECDRLWVLKTLHFLQNSQNLVDRKCLGKLRKS